MAAKQTIFRFRRNYNQWVNNQTLEDYALRFTAVGARKWSLTKVANTALGAISFLALEAIGGAITLSYGFDNAALAILVVSVLIFLAGIPICFYAAKYGVDIDLLTRGAGFGYIGSTATSLIYASFTFIFFALEAAIMAKALELMTGLPLAWGYVVSSVVIIPMVFHGITFISRFQLWTQPLWIVLQILPLAAIMIHDISLVSSWTQHTGTHQNDNNGISVVLFGAAASVLFALVAQIGEQVDFLRFLPEKTPQNSTRWWAALLAAGPGWVIIGAIKLFVGSFLAFVALQYGKSLADASDPTSMYTVAYIYLTQNPNTALWLAGIFVVISQLKINVTNAYAGSIAWSNFFSRLTHSHPGRVIWLVFNVAIALLLMELGVYHAFEKTLSVYAIVAVAWVSTLVADLVVNKPLKLSPNYIEFKRAYLFDINPVGVGSMISASLMGIVAYLGAFGEAAHALAHFISMLAAFVLTPLIAWATQGRYYIARHALLASSLSNECSICQNQYEHQDMALCPAYEGPICSLCCSLDSRCRDTCKSVNNFLEQLSTLLQNVLPLKLKDYINIRLMNFLVLLIFVAGVTGILLSLIYSNSILDDAFTDALLASTLWKVFFILLIVAGVISWLFVLAHDSRLVAQEESQNQTRLLLEEIEAHRNTDQMLQSAKEAAEAANNAKSRYLTGISHELRTPLNSILGYAQLLEGDSRLPAQALHQIEVIKRSGEHLADLIEGLLDISKIEAGRLEIQRNTIALKPMMNQLVDMFRLQAQEKGLDFIYQRQTPLPDFVQGDEKRLRQILINLLSNAVKFTQRGSVKLNIRYRNQVATIQITDSGIGIPESEMERIFKPFERIRLPGAPPVSGTGLGLTITKLLVDIMGGDLVVTANPEGGITFSVWLMLAHVSQPKRAADAHETVCGYEGARKSVMIVDDDAAHRGLLHDLLTPLGFIVVEAQDGPACLKLARSFCPDIFLIDRRMPGMEGPELAKALRQQGISQPIVMISANANEDTASDGDTQEYNDYIVKPIKLNKILEKLAIYLGVIWHYEDKKPLSLALPAQTRVEQWVYPEQEVIDELIGWAEVGALGKLKDIVDRLEKSNGASPGLIAELRTHIAKVELDRIAHALKVSS